VVNIGVIIFLVLWWCRFGSKRDVCRELHKEELSNLYTLHISVMVM
jgi:hypothetical protein